MRKLACAIRKLAKIGAVLTAAGTTANLLAMGLAEFFRLLHPRTAVGG